MRRIAEEKLELEENGVYVCCLYCNNLLAAQMHTVSKEFDPAGEISSWMGCMTLKPRLGGRNILLDWVA